jgi:hypothetical protein
MPELPANLQLALEACRACARTTPTGEIWFNSIAKEYKAKGVTRQDLARLESHGYLIRTGEGRYDLAIHFPETFDWWSRRFKWHRFPFECSCGVEVPIRHRVAQNTRVCRGCGEPVTVQAIDHQLRRWEPERQRIMDEEKKSGVLSTLGTIGVVAAAGLMWGVSLVFGKKR